MRNEIIFLTPGLFVISVVPKLSPLSPPFSLSSLRPCPTSISEKQFLVRSTKICPQVEIALEGGVLKCTSPFRAMSLGAKIGAYHEK